MALKTFTWCVDAGATEELELKTNVTQFGDGYEQVSSIGINNARTSWQFSRKGKAIDVNPIYAFLKEHGGVTPFIMTIDGETKTYRTDGNISRNHLGADVWQVSFNVKQVFIP